MRKPLFAALLIVASSAALVAQDVPQLPGAVDPSRVASGSYVTDPEHTLVGWSVNHFGFNDYFGQFGDATGSLVLDTSDLSKSSVDVTIPISSIAVVSSGLREHLFKAGTDGAAPDFFGPDPAPAHFVSFDVRPGTGDRSNEATITGNLTLNGQTKPVTILAEFTGAGTNPMKQADTVGFEGRALIKRSDFGMTYGLPFVGDEITLTISAAFEKSGEIETADACGASKVEQYRGQKDSADLRKKIETESGAASIRWLNPTSAVTMDYRPDRLNVVIDPDTGLVMSLRCS